MIVGAGGVKALSNAQKQLFERGVYMFDIETGCTSRSDASYGGWDVLALTYPEIPEEPALIASVKQFIQRPGAYPRSPFVSNPQHVNSVFTLSKQHNVNPLLILSIAKQENQFGSVGSAALEKNNYFGITFSDNGVKTYRTFGSPEEGIEYFVKDVGDNIADTNGLYRKRGLTNFYEYLNIHQMGFIAYPGEYPPEAPGANATPPYLFEDTLMNVRVDWESPYNPGNYYKNSIAFINTLTGLSLPETPSKGGACSADGWVNTEGYAWPIGAPKEQFVDNFKLDNCRRLNPVTVGDWQSFPENRGKELPRACHDADVKGAGPGGNSAAFDLYRPGSPNSELAGKPLYAIIDGTVRDVRHSSETCYSFDLVGKDKYHYWYGHVTAVGTYSNGALVTPLGPGKEMQVVAGQQIAKIDLGYWPGHCNGTSGRTHLHIDRGCVRLRGGERVYNDGGSPSCRDPDFVQLLQSIYNELPE
jgi:hypothetical protein